MKVINNNSTVNEPPDKLFVLFMKKLGIKVSEMVKFLDVSPNTVYNYRTMNDDDIPAKITDSILEFLRVDNTDMAKDLLLSLNQITIEPYIKRFLQVIKSKSLLNRDEYSDAKNDSDTVVSQSNNQNIGSEVFMNALWHEIAKVVNGLDDYEFIAYLKKYGGGHSK